MHKDRPDKPGRWWFQGMAITRVGRVQVVDRVQNRPLEINDDMAPIDPNSRQRLEGVELIGWWVEEMAQA